MSTLNFGSAISDNLGGLITWGVGVTAHNFDNLWLLVFICNVTNLIPIPLLFYLVPTEEEIKKERDVPIDSDSIERERLTQSNDDSNKFENNDSNNNNNNV